MDGGGGEVIWVEPTQNKNLRKSLGYKIFGIRQTLSADLSFQKSETLFRIFHKSNKDASCFAKYQPKILCQTL